RRRSAPTHAVVSRTVSRPMWVVGGRVLSLKNLPRCAVVLADHDVAVIPVAFGVIPQAIIQGRRRDTAQIEGTSKCRIAHVAAVAIPEAPAVFRGSRNQPDFRRRIEPDFERTNAVEVVQYEIIRRILMDAAHEFGWI